MSDRPEEVDELLSMISEKWDKPEVVIEGIVTELGINLDDVPAKDAKAAMEASEDEDVDEFFRLLEKNSEEPEKVEQFRQQHFQEGESEPRDNSGGDSEDSEVESDSKPAAKAVREGATGGGGGDSPSRAEVQQMIQQATPSADEIVSQLKSEMGGQQQPAADGGAQAGEMNPQTEMALKLVAQHLGGGNESPYAEMMEEMQKDMMKSTMQQVASQAGMTPGQRVGAAVDDQIGEEIAKNIEINLGGKSVSPGGTGDDDSDSSGSDESGDSDE